MTVTGWGSLRWFVFAAPLVAALAVDAKPHYREVVERCRKVLGNDHPFTLTCISNFGYVLMELNKLHFVD